MNENQPLPPIEARKPKASPWEISTYVLIIITIIILFSVNNTQRLIVLLSIALVGIYYYFITQNRKELDVMDCVKDMSDTIFKKTGIKVDTTLSRMRVEIIGEYCIANFPLRSENPSRAIQELRSFIYHIPTKRIIAIGIFSPYELQERIRNDMILQEQIRRGIAKREEEIYT